MPFFKIKAYDSKGDLKTLRRESNTEDELLRSLSLEGYVPVSFVVEKSRRSSSSAAAKPLKLTDQHLFCTMLSAFLQGGLSMTEVLGLLQSQTRDKRLQPLFGELKDLVESGRSLAQSMRTQGVFRESLVGMIESGERSSSLPNILDKAAELLQSEISLRQKLRSALTYPIFMLIVGVGVVAFLLAYVVPQLTGIVVSSGKELPLITRALLSVSYAVRVGALPAILIGLLVYIQLRRRGKKISIPLFGGIRNMLTMSLIFSQLSTLIRSGIPLVQALELSEPLDTQKGRIKFLAEEVRKGYRFSQSLERQGTFSEDAIAIVRIGEVGGNLPDCLERVAVNLWTFAQLSMQKWSSLAEPIIIIVMGVIVGFVIMAVLVPIFSLSELSGL
ncbi:MAG: type II secretion system F family protein [Synergistaceae bacterium]|jgi:type II secretory pathway component PulF|nr:type II secretion system F family protein [Synergistaceae bacterium]